MTWTDFFSNIGGNFGLVLGIGNHFNSGNFLDYLQDIWHLVLFLAMTKGTLYNFVV
jgi:hypothetical protein